MARNMRGLRERGTAPLKTVLDFCHAHGREMFASFRMNMIQDSWRPDFHLPWKRDHPDCLLGDRGSREFGDPDDVEQAAADDALTEIKLQLSLRHFDPRRDEATFAVNGRELHGRFTKMADGVGVLPFTLFTLYTDVIRQPPVVKGTNTIRIVLGERRSEYRSPVDLVSAEMWIRY